MDNYKVNDDDTLTNMYFYFVRSSLKHLEQQMIKTDKNIEEMVTSSGKSIKN
jgi:hypothetical protein